MKTIIKLPNNLVDTQYNSTIVAALATIIVVGLMLIFSHNIIDYENDTPISILITCGIFTAITAAIALTFSLKQTVLSSNGTPLMCTKIEFHESEYEKIKEITSSNRWSEIEDIKKDGSGTAMKMEFIYSKDKSFAAYQFFKYVPHIYESCGDIIYLDKEYVSTIGKS